jgi:hypothetical protein
MTHYGALVLLVLFAAACLGGCATYVNIPPQVGDVAQHDPNLETVLKVELQALRALEEDRPPAKTYRVVLPPGTSTQSYDAIVPQVSTLAIWTGAVAATQPASGGGGTEDGGTVEIRQVRIRGGFAQADIVRPADAAQPNGPQQLATVSLKWDMIVGWHVNRVRIWRIGVDDALVHSIREAEIDIQK